MSHYASSVLSSSSNANRCETLEGLHMIRENKQPQDCNNKKRADPTATNETKPKRLAKLHAKAEATKLTA